jgi:hypothetical protein
MDKSEDNGARTRLLEFLLQVRGVKYIPDAARAKLYRRIASQLRAAKNSRYGWATEERESVNAQQFGPHVPSIAFEEFYQELLAVWVGNYWGRSEAQEKLGEFITSLNTDQLRKILGLFRTNERVQEELGFIKPKAEAIKLVSTIKDRFTIESHKNEADDILDFVEKY